MNEAEEGRDFWVISLVIFMRYSHYCHGQLFTECTHNSKSLMIESVSNPFHILYSAWNRSSTYESLIKN